jgi:N-acetylmuramoyl-L-alanine amidase
MEPEPKILRLKHAVSVCLVAVCAAATGKASLVSLENTITPEAIVIHHSGIDAQTNDAAVHAVDIARWHRERGLTSFYWGRSFDAGYHYVVEPGGHVVRTRPESCIGAHVRGHNDSLGICVIGYFDSTVRPENRPSDEQLRALTDLTVEIMRRRHWGASRLVRHSDLNAHTECPGPDFPWATFVGTVLSRVSARDPEGPHE